MASTPTSKRKSTDPESCRVGDIAIVDVRFHGDPLLGILTERGAFVPLRPLVIGMGLDWTAQLRRVQRDPVLAEATTTFFGGGEEGAVCLPLGLVPGFLFGIDASRVAVAVRGRVLAYQRGCFEVLAESLLRAEAPASPSQAAAIRPATRLLVLKLRLGAAFWTAVAAAIGAYLFAITLGRRGRRRG